MGKHTLVKILGLISFTALAVLAYMLYLERTVYTDLAFHTVHLLVEKKLFIQNHRFGAMFTQVFPLAAHALHLPLKGILIAYSEAFIIYYACIFFACVLLLKQPRWALVIILLPFFIVTHTFYWAQSELPQGLAFLILTCAFGAHCLQQPQFKWWHYALLAIMGVFLVFFHPLIIFPVIFTGAFFFLRETNPGTRNKILLSVGLFIAGLILQKIFIKATAYDRSSAGRLLNIIKIFPCYFALPSNKLFIKNCLQHYYLLPLAVAAVVLKYWLSRQWKLLALFAMFITGYFLMVNISYYEGNSPAYIENLYYPLTLMVLIPFVFDVVWPVKNLKVAAAVFTIALGVRLLDIAHSRAPYTSKLNNSKNFLARTARWPSKKLVINNAAMPVDTVGSSWSSADEFLLLSALEHPDSARCVLITNDFKERIQTAMPERDQWASQWYYYKYEKFDPHLFHFSDTSEYAAIDTLPTLY